AVAVAWRGAPRRGDVYKETVAKALASPDPELRQIAFAASRAVRTGTQAAEDEGPSPAAAVNVLADANATAQHDGAKAQIKAALKKDPTAAATALTDLVANEHAPTESRVFAI